MNFIYHEKQEGSLCAQHCLNNLLQGQYFSAIDLAEIANQIDKEEQQCMGEMGTNTEDYRKFLEQPSSNMDDSGMFSVQVLSAALRIWELNLVPLASSNTLAATARQKPEDQIAFICNFREHWLTVRKLGRQWFNLNSLLTFPELISNTYLSLFLRQLQHEGYSIFVLDGNFPPSEADAALLKSPATQIIKPQLLSEVNAESPKSSGDSKLKDALSASLSKYAKTQPRSQQQSSHEDELEAALRMSIEESPSTSVSQFDNDETELAQAISLSLADEGAQERAAETSRETKGSAVAKSQSDADLEKALQMSLDSSLCDAKVPEGPLDSEIEMVRRKRLAKLDKKL